MRTDQQKQAALLAKELRYLKNAARRSSAQLKKETTKQLQETRRVCRKKEVLRIARRNTCVSESDAEKLSARARAAVECTLKRTGDSCKAARVDANKAAKRKQGCVLEDRAERQANREACAVARWKAQAPYEEAKAEYLTLRQKEQSARAQAGYSRRRRNEARAHAADEVRFNLEAIDPRLIPVFNKRRRHYKGTGEQMTAGFLQDMHDEGWFEAGGDVYHAALNDALQKGEREAERVLGVKRAKGKRRKNRSPVPF